jgi:RimJ/RimL family protein N-acetyltransferase
MIGNIRNCGPCGSLVIGKRLSRVYFDFMLEILNDLDISRMEGKIYKKHSLANQENWFKMNKNNVNSDFWVFIDRKGKNPVGYVSVKRISNDLSIAHVGIKICGKYQGKGFGKDILNAIESYYFIVCKLDKLVSHIVEYNKASLHLFIKSNKWKEVGLKKDTVILENEKFDQIEIELSRTAFLRDKLYSI